MSLLRRRLLLAKKPSGGGTYDEYFGHIPPESTEFGFPLYITVPRNSDSNSNADYQKNSDSIVAQLFNWCNENCEIEESVGFFTTYAVGFNGLYINGVEVKGAYKDVTIGDVMEDVLWTFRQYDGNLGDKIIYNMGIDCDFIFIMLS